MTKWLRFVAPLVFALAAACSGSDAGSNGAKPVAPPPAKKSAAELRADELIADLKKREDAQAKVQYQAINEVPPRSTAARSSAPVQSSAEAGHQPAAAPGGTDNDANYWRQEFSMASARLQSATQQLEQARQKMNDAQSQASNSNSAVSKIGQESYNRAQQEFYAAQSAVGSAQSAVSMARQNALNAGVPPSFLR